MQTTTDNRITPAPLTPIEQYFRDYVVARGGVLDELEPQVYDVLLDTDLLRIAFDPEALPEHPQAQLAAFGSPLIDRLLADAATRWNSGVCYQTGTHLDPFNLEKRVARSVATPDGAVLRIDRARAMHFPLALYWFRAIFTSDQKEEVVLPVGIDLHELREVRQLDRVLELDRLSSEPQLLLPEAPHRGVVAGYRTALAHARRSVSPLANARRRDWASAVEKQITRMRDYYARLREESSSPPARITDPDAAEARRRDRLTSIHREEQLRIAELQRKADLRVEVKLSSLLIVHQPKLLLHASVVPRSGAAFPLKLVWNPGTDAVEAVTCPACGQPGFELRIGRKSLCCPRCDRS